MIHNEEQKLIARSSRGDQNALGILFGRYLKPVHSFVYRYVGNAQDAEDVTQEAFVKVWRNLKRFDKEKSFKTWLFSIAKNTAIDFLKKKKALPFSAFENNTGKNYLLEKLRSALALPSELFEQKERGEFMQKLLSSLSHAYSTVLSLRYNNDLTFREIAKELGEPLNTVKSHHHRALFELKKHIGR